MVLVANFDTSHVPRICVNPGAQLTAFFEHAL